jgi:hypothetical protein
MGLQAFEHAFRTGSYQTCITCPITDEAAGRGQDQRALVTCLQQMRVTDHIDSEDRGETASGCSHFQGTGRTLLDGAPSSSDVFDHIYAPAGCPIKPDRLDAAPRSRTGHVASWIPAKADIQGSPEGPGAPHGTKSVG